MSEVRHMDIKEFCDLGFLQEINRLILHPCGLALEVTVDDDGKQWISGVWDYRDDPEGMFFDWAAWSDRRNFAPDPLAKANSVTREVNRHREAREKLFTRLYPHTRCSDPTIEPLPSKVVGDGKSLDMSKGDEGEEVRARQSSSQSDLQEVREEAPAD